MVKLNQERLFAKIVEKRVIEELFREEDILSTLQRWVENKDHPINRLSYDHALKPLKAYIIKSLQQYKQSLCINVRSGNNVSIIESKLMRLLKLQMKLYKNQEYRQQQTQIFGPLMDILVWTCNFNLVQCVLDVLFLQEMQLFSRQFFYYLKYLTAHLNIYNPREWPLKQVLHLKSMAFSFEFQWHLGSGNIHITDFMTYLIDNELTLYNFYQVACWINNTAKFNLPQDSMIFHGLMIKVKMFLEDDIDALVRSIMMAHSVFCRLQVNYLRPGVENVLCVPNIFLLPPDYLILFQQFLGLLFERSLTANTQVCILRNIKKIIKCQENTDSDKIMLQFHQNSGLLFKLTNSLKQAITNIDIEESVGSVGKGMALSVIKSSEFIREVLEIAQKQLGEENELFWLLEDIAWIIFTNKSVLEYNKEVVEMSGILLVIMQHDEQEVTRFILGEVEKSSKMVQTYLKTLNKLITSKDSRNRQRRDVATIARLVAESSTIKLLQEQILKEVTEQRVNDESITIQTTHLITNICIQNPLLIQNIMQSCPSIIDTLLDIFQSVGNTPSGIHSLQCIVNFLHAISLKEGPIRNQKLRKPFQQLLINIFTNNKYCEALCSETYLGLQNSLLRFYSNILIVGKYIFHAIIKATRVLNKQYHRIMKQLTEIFEGRVQKEQLRTVMESLGFVDCELALLVRLISHLRELIIYKFDKYSLFVLLRGLIKLSYGKLSVLVDTAYDNKSIANLIADITDTISKHYEKATTEQTQQNVDEEGNQQGIQQTNINNIVHEVSAHLRQNNYDLSNIENVRIEINIVPVENQQPIEQMIDKQGEEDQDVDIEEIVEGGNNQEGGHNQEGRNNQEGVNNQEGGNNQKGGNNPETEDKDKALKAHKHLNFLVDAKYSEKFKLCLLQIANTLSHTFDVLVQRYGKDWATFRSFWVMQDYVKQYDSLDIDHFVISTFTGRLYRHLTHANTNFDKNHFESQDYMSCVDKLSRLNPCYFNICLLSRIKTIEETLNEDEFFNSTRESEMQTTRFYMERLNEGAIQKIFLSKMAKKQTIYDQTFDSLIKFCCLGCGNIESNFEIFIKSILHPFIEYFSDRYLPEMQNEQLSMKDIEAIRLALKIVLDFFHSGIVENLVYVKLMRQRIIRYCRVCFKNKQQFTIFHFIAKIINKLEKHDWSKTIDLLNTRANCYLLVKNIFLKGINQRLLTFLKYWQFTTPYLQDHSTPLAMQMHFIDSTTRKFLIVLHRLINLRRQNNPLKKDLISMFYLKMQRPRTQKISLQALKKLHEENSFGMFQSVDVYKNRLKDTVSSIYAVFANNIDQPIYHIPMLVITIVFESQIENALNKKFLAEIFMDLSCRLNCISLRLKCQNLNLSVKITNQRYESMCEQLDLKKQVRALNNICLFMGQFMLQLKGLEYFNNGDTIYRLQYIEAVVKLSTYIFGQFAAEQYFPEEADELVFSLLWMVEIYLKYRQSQNEFNKKKKKEKRVIRQSQKKEKMKENKLRSKQGENANKLLKNKDLIGQGEKNLQLRSCKQMQVTEEHTEGKVYKRSRPAHDTVEQQKPNKQQSSKKPPEPINQKKKNKGKAPRDQPIQNFSAIVTEFLRVLLTASNRATKAFISNQSLQYIINVIIDTTKQTHPEAKFHIDNTHLLPELLKIKVKGGRVVSYHCLLYRMSFNMVTLGHQQIEREAYIKRLFWQNTNNGKKISAEEFVDLTLSAFGSVPDFSSIMQLSRQVDGVIKKLDYNQKNVRKLFGKLDLYNMELKEGVENHLINCIKEHDKRRHSSVDEDKVGKLVKFYDYVPDGAISRLITEIITSIIRVVIEQLAASVEFRKHQIKAEDRLPSEWLPKLQQQSDSQPFCLKVLLHSLHLFVRGMPALAPYIARFKCTKIILHELQILKSEAKHDVQAFLFRLLYNSQSPQKQPQIRFLVFTLRVLCPLLSNSVVPLILQLCFDNTIFVQHHKNNTNHPFAALVRIKILDQTQRILKLPNKYFLYNKLVMMSLLTVLLAIREMCKLCLESSFISKLYGYMEQIKRSVFENTGPPMPLTRVLVAFFLTPISILQELNISLMVQKKQGKALPPICLKRNNDKDSINCQLMTNQAFKPNKFKNDWLFLPPFDSNNQQNSQQDSDEQQSMQFDSSQAESWLDISNLADNMDYMSSELDMESSSSRSQQNQWDITSQSMSNESLNEYSSLSFHDMEEIDQQDDEGGDDNNEPMQIDVENQSSRGVSYHSVQAGEQPRDNNQMGTFEAYVQQFQINQPNEGNLCNDCFKILTFQDVLVCSRICQTEQQQITILRKLFNVVCYPKRKQLPQEILASDYEVSKDILREQDLYFVKLFQRQVLLFAEYVNMHQIIRYQAQTTKRTYTSVELFNMPYAQPESNRNETSYYLCLEQNFESVEASEEREQGESPVQEAGQEQPMENLQQQERQQNNSQEVPEQLVASNLTLRQFLDTLGISVEQFNYFHREMQEDILSNLVIESVNQRERAAGQATEPIVIEDDMGVERERTNQRQQQLVQQRNMGQEEGPEASQGNATPIRGINDAEQGQAHQQAVNLQQGQQAQQQVHQIYRKMSLEHTKQINKDLMQVLNKDGKNNVRFVEISDSVMQILLEMFYVLNGSQHMYVPYQLFECLCLNTVNETKLISSLLVLLHLTQTSEQFTLLQNTHLAARRIIKTRIMTSQGEIIDDYNKIIFPSVQLKILHLLSHLTKSYSFSMSMLRVHSQPVECLKGLESEKQSCRTALEMLILMLEEKTVSESGQHLHFLVRTIDHITAQHFMRNVHKIMSKNVNDQTSKELQSNKVQISHEKSVNNNLNQQDNKFKRQKYQPMDEQPGSDKILQTPRTSLDPISIRLLGDLLQSDDIKQSIYKVSKIIMRLSIQQHNLNGFIAYFRNFIQYLSSRSLQEIERWAAIQQHIVESLIYEQAGSFKIVRLLSIFYQMVRSFEKYPSSSDRQKTVMLEFRRIVQCDKLYDLCQKAANLLLHSQNTVIQNKMGQIMDCFFILYQICLASSNRAPMQKDDEHKHIAELGQINLVQMVPMSHTNDYLTSGHQTVMLGTFNLTKFWQQNIAHPSFKVYINNNIKKKLFSVYREHLSAHQSLFDVPIIKVSLSTPHMLSFENKRSLFKAEVKRLKGKHKYEPILLEIRREDVFVQSFDEIMNRKPEQLKGKLKIQFENEEGEDAGGLTREWYQLLSKRMFDANYALFKRASAGNTHHPSSMSYVNSLHEQYFKFVGRITGKALHDGYMLQAYFTPAFYKHILDLSITYRDMEEEDYQYFKSLQWLLDNSPIEDYLELNFTYEFDNFGEIQTKELVPNGSNILVTEENKLQYVQLISYAKMATNIKVQLENFLAGLHDLIPHRLIRIFNQKQLQIMISGRPTIDIEDLRRNTELVNYVNNDQVIIWFFEVLQSFDMPLRTAFIQFVTGSSRVPVEGFKDLQGMNGIQKFNIHREFQNDRLPRAHTCFNQLDLPNYSSKQILIEKLKLAITEGKQGFGLL